MTRRKTARGRMSLRWMISMMLAALAASVALADEGSIASSSPPPLRFDRTSVPVGASVVARATGLPAGAAATLMWETVNGGWVVEDYYKFRGKRFVSTERHLADATVGSDGTLRVRFTVPRDYGGVHEIVVLTGGRELARGGLEVTPTFDLNVSEGPVGTLIEIRGNGLGWRTMESTWVVNWDNHEIGWLSAVDTGGSALARFRAAGPVGDHFIKLYTGYMGQSYLNFQQAPTAYLPRPEFVFRVTPGQELPTSYAEPYQAQLQSTESSIGARISMTPAQGPVKTVARLKGTGFPANERIDLVWETWSGSRVTQAGFDARTSVLGQLTVGADGSIGSPVTIPDDLGGRHFLVIQQGKRELGRVSFFIETSIESMFPTSGPAGTEVTLHLKGVGWTEYDNIYVATYDNAYMGYACGFNSQGDVQITFIAAGAPGIHLIDLYPGIYKGPSHGQQLYRLPQLTYATDHPGNKIPALRFAFRVTP